MAEPNKLAAITLLGSLTRGYFNVYEVSGPSNVRHRQLLMTLLCGEKLPQSKCGVNALMNAFHDLCDIHGTCGADRQDAFEIYCKDFLAQQGPLPEPQLIA